MRWSKPVYTYEELLAAVQDPATHVIMLEVAFSLVQRRTVKGTVWVGRSRNCPPRHRYAF
jgi:hypothetical protein